MGKLDLNAEHIKTCRESAHHIAKPVIDFTHSRSTFSIERSILRLLGVTGADETGVPFVNRIISSLDKKGLVQDGIAIHLGYLAIKKELSLDEIIIGLINNKIHFTPIEKDKIEKSQKFIEDECTQHWMKIRAKLDKRDEFRKSCSNSQQPLADVLIATGDIYEDARHAESVAQHGGDVVELIRSTAQSLLDYVPYGLTREGYGGTYATQENFRFLRESLNNWSKKNGRYIQLSSFSSGLCMPEISAIGAIECLDNMVNDAMYGILYRDINMERTLIDQAFSRSIKAAAGIVINTGEDNYLKTADPILAAPSVIASEMINYEMARLCGLSVEQIGIANAFEISPETENSLLFEWSQAQLTRELFPESPVNYMPPTRYMNGNLFRTHACDTLFNLVSVATNQGLQTIGVPTEGIFTPHIQDRVLALECVKYVKLAAKNLFDEIEFVKDGLIQTHANKVLEAAAGLLKRIASGKDGLFGAIESGVFGDVKRSRAAGRGLEGVFVRNEVYINPFEAIFAKSK